MKRLISFLCVLAMLLTLLPMAAFAAEGESVDFVVLSTTDMHGKCWDKNVLTDGNENNNMLRVSTAVQGYRETYGENLLLIDNGDTYQGTPVSTVQLGKITSGESDLPAAMALCLGDIGYDVSVLGNHEFNYPWSTMSGIYAYLETRGVPIITANLYYDGSDGVHARGENVFTPYLVKTITVNGNTHKIGVLGFENTDCTRWDVPDNYPGIVFAHPDNTQMSMAWEAQRYIPQMQAEGCEFIIVSYHSGTGSASGELVFGQNTEGQVSRLIAECEGIDMVIAGHDHSSSYSNTYLQDKNGKDVLVVNGGGQQLTQSIFTFTEEGGKLAYTVKESKNLNLANYTSDAALKAKIEPYAAMAVEYVNQSAGTAVGTWDTSHNYYLEQTDTIDLINHVQMTYGSKYMARKYDTDEKKAELYAATGLDHIEVDISAASPVTSNNYYVKPGEITMKTIVQMYKYDNNVLYLLPLTGKQIKDVMEQNASTRLKATVKNGAVSYTAIGDNFTNVVFGGINFVYDMYQPEGSRVVISGLSNGKAFELDKTYVVACNSYHLGNTGCGFGAFAPSDSIWNQNDDLAGANIQEAILEYIQDKGEISTEPFTWTWKLDYTGDLNAPTSLEGDLVAQKTDTLENGDEIVIYYDADATVIGTKPAADDRRLAAVNTTSYQDYIAFSSDAAVFTVEKVEGENDPFRLKNEKGYLVAGQTGNSLGFAEEASDLAEWYLVPVEGGYHIMNVGANYGGNHNQAIEWYSGFTTYGVKDTAIYLFNLYKLVDAAKRVDELTDGRQYVIYLDSEGLSVGTEENSGGLAAVKNTASGDFMLLPLTEGTLVATAELGEDGKIAFVSEDGKHLTSKPTGNGIYLADEPAADELSLWRLVPVDGGFHVMSVGANYNGNHNQALEYYGGKFTTYGVKDTDIYLFNLYELPEQEAEDGFRVALITDFGGPMDGGFNQKVYEEAVGWCAANDAAFDCWTVEGMETDDIVARIGAISELGTDVLLLPGFGFAEAVAQTAERYPDMTFIVFDVNQYELRPEDAGDDWTLPKNVFCAVYREEQAGFLAGYAAVAMGYNKLGFLGGPEFPGITRYGYGFVQGADAAAKDLDRIDEVEVKHVYTGQFVPNPEMTEFVEGWFEDGVEVVFGCGGGIIASAAEAAKLHNGKVIGVDTDQAAWLDGDFGEGITLTSAVKNLDVTTSCLLERIKDGSFEGGKEEAFGIVSLHTTDNHVGLAPTTRYNDSFTEANYNDLLGKISRGELTVSDETEAKPDAEIDVFYQCYTACDWGEPAYEWAEDNSSCTATRVCKNDETHVETETVTASSEITQEPTEEAEGVMTYTAVFENPAFETQTVTAPIDKLEPSQPENPFVDVPEDAYYYDAVLWAVENNVTNGTDDTHFSPNNKCTRAQVVAFLWRAKGSPAPTSTENPFTDVPADKYYTDAVLWAVENKITSGTAKDKFSPNAPCTRGQVVTFLWRAQGEPEPTASSPFTDVSDAAYYYKAVLWAVENGVTNGKTPTTFGPADTCTRGQIVTFLYRALAGIGNS